jgi:hypothetical protein
LVGRVAPEVSVGTDSARPAVVVGSVLGATVSATAAATVSLTLSVLLLSLLPQAASMRETAMAAGAMVRDNEIMGAPVFQVVVADVHDASGLLALR